jgi:hypothetical protein
MYVIVSFFSFSTIFLFNIDGNDILFGSTTTALIL